jgi:DNA-binding MarR family transcriptional regulator
MEHVNETTAALLSWATTTAPASNIYERAMLIALAAAPAAGTIAGELAQTIMCSPRTALRTLAALEAAGMAERTDEPGGWRLAPSVRDEHKAAG